MILKWALNGKDADKVIHNGNAIHDQSTNDIYKCGMITVEGKTDKINNIYDLEGNCSEWTLETFSNYGRSTRSSSYAGEVPLFSRGKSGVVQSNRSFGTRPVLYIVK